MQQKIFTLFIFIGVLFFANSALALKPKRPKQARKVGLQTIVIDAGHGGKDPGANGSPKTESKVTLAIALKLGRLIEDNLPDVKVIYTRSTDKFVELYERANIANRNNADLFISIHCNSLPAASRVQGTEVYVMGLHTADENLEISKKVAERENQTILLEDNYKKNYGGFDPRDPATHILLSMTQNVHLDQSIAIASNIIKECKSLGQPTRGVHQAGFVVIRATAMPSMLVETGYLTSAADNKRLQSESGQQTIAKAIFRAVRSFKYELEGKKKEGNDDEIESVIETQDNLANEQPSASTNETNSPQASLDNEAERKTDTPSKHKKRKNNPPLAVVDSPTLTATDNAIIAPMPTEAGTVYYIQIVSNNQPLTDSYPKFKGLPQIYQDLHGGLYKYMVGTYSSLEAAAKAQTEWRRKGYNGAFVVTYVAGLRK